MSRAAKRWVCLVVLGLLAVTQAGLAAAGCMVNHGETARMLGAHAGGSRQEAAPRGDQGMSSASACQRHCTGKFQLSRQSDEGFVEAPAAAPASPLLRVAMPREAWLPPAPAPRTPIPIRILLHSFLI